MAALGVTSSLRITVQSQSDVEEARRAAKQSARESYLDAERAEEWILVASELASNLLFHARGGELNFSTTEDPRRALVLECWDTGPGIADLTSAMRDGYSTRGGLGGGLSTIRDFSDDLSIESSEAGTRITVKKWLS